MNNSSRTILWVTIFSIAFAFVEASVVVYLRAIYYPEGFVFPLKIVSQEHLTVELSRETATIVMLAGIGILAGTSPWQKFGYFLMSFGVWDVFYYVWLKVILDWPSSILDWDVLFLLPLPWWGPVLAPVSIALVMILWGTLATQSGNSATDARWAWALACVGMVLALGLFMIDSGRALPDGRDAVLQVLPSTFNWPLFCLALLLIASPAVHQVAALPTKKSVLRRL